MTTKLDEISEAIGALRSDVKNLRTAVEHSERQSAESTRRADDHRAVIHRRVDDLVDEVGDLKSRVSTMDDTVKDSKTITDEVKEWKQRGIGALFVAGIAGSAIGAAVVGFIAYWYDAIMRVLKAA